MLIKTPTDIGALIKEARLKAGLSQHDLAQILKTSQGWVSEIERGKPRAELGLVLKAINALGINLDSRPTGGQPSTARPRVGIAAVLDRTKGA